MAPWRTYKDEEIEAMNIPPELRAKAQWEFGGGNLPTPRPDTFDPVRDTSGAPPLPVTPRPVSTPPELLRQRTGVEYQMSPQARDALGRTPLRVDPAMAIEGYMGYYDPESSSIGVAMFDPRTVAHETSHLWRDRQGMNFPDNTFQGDSMQAYNESKPVYGALEQWQGDQLNPVYSDMNPGWKNDEILARVVESNMPTDIPQWYRDRYLPDLYRNDLQQPPFQYMPQPTYGPRPQPDRQRYAPDVTPYPNWYEMNEG